MMHECTCNPGFMRDTLIPMVGIITDIRTETPDVKTFRVNAPGGGKLFEHLPGQCAMICAPGVGEAMFSITSSPTNREYQEFSIKRCGVLTEHLHSLQVGDEIMVRGPYGNNFPVETELKGKTFCSSPAVLPLHRCAASSTMCWTIGRITATLTSSTALGVWTILSSARRSKRFGRKFPV